MSPDLKENIISQCLTLLDRGMSVQAVRLRLSGAQATDGTHVSEADRHQCLLIARIRHMAAKKGSEA